MSDTSARSEVIDLDALAGTIADQLRDPTYCMVGQVGGGTGFVRFDTASTHSVGVGEVTIRATVELVCDGEDEIEGAAGEVVEIVVRRNSGRPMPGLGTQHGFATGGE